MTPQEFKEIWNLLGTLGIGAVIGAVVMFFVGKWFGAYAAKKGENLATKEDIAEITAEVKGVEHQFNELLESTKAGFAEVLEERKAHNTLRFSALEKRLQAHQEAFEHWRKLIRAPQEKVDSVVVECEQFWEKNCLYLEPSVRIAFVESYSAKTNILILQKHGGTGEQLIAEFRKMNAFPDILLEATKLPAFSPLERKGIMAKEPESQ